MYKCPGNYEEKSDSNTLYAGNHKVDIVRNSMNEQQSISFHVTEIDNVIKIKIRNPTDYTFNYTAMVDWKIFEKMKRDQHLDIDFHEFKPQIIDLFHLSEKKQMLIRLEFEELRSLLIFYEKSRIKSLVFLILNLHVTDHDELMEEMAGLVAILKEQRNGLQNRVNLMQKRVHDAEIQLRGANLQTSGLERMFHETLDLILKTFNSQLGKIEVQIANELSKLVARHEKIDRDLHVLRTENMLKCQSSARLVQSMQNLRMETERNATVIDDLKNEMDVLNGAKRRAEKTCGELQETIVDKDAQIESLERQLKIMKKDVHEAALILAQKTKKNEELEKDVAQANHMLVKFNNQYDTLSKKMEDLQREILSRDRIVAEKHNDLEKLQLKFEQYQKEYNVEDYENLHQELMKTNQRLHELEKENREVVKMNNLLTQRLAPSHFPDPRFSPFET